MDIIRKNNITGNLCIDELVYILNGIYHNKNDQKPQDGDAQERQELTNYVEINPLFRLEEKKRMNFTGCPSYVGYNNNDEIDINCRENNRIEL